MEHVKGYTSNSLNSDNFRIYPTNQLLTLFRMGGVGEKAPLLPTSFSPVTFTKVVIDP